jgi:hypothetical protein
MIFKGIELNQIIDLGGNGNVRFLKLKENNFYIGFYTKDNFLKKKKIEGGKQIFNFVEKKAFFKINDFTEKIFQFLMFSARKNYLNDNKFDSKFAK